MPSERSSVAKLEYRARAASRGRIPVNKQEPNLFRGLLSYRPRPHRDSRENFLTEALAYVLATDPDLALIVAEAFTGHRFDIKEVTGIETQSSLRDTNARGLVDMMIEAVASDGQKLNVWIENKWDAYGNAKQLESYLQAIAKRTDDAKQFLVLLTPRHTDGRLCEKVKVNKVPLNYMNWSELHEIVSKSSTALSREFEAFLCDNRLSAQPITLRSVQEDYRSLQSGKVRMARNLRQRLRVLCDRVIDGLDSTEISEDAYLDERYGRVGLWMFQSRVTLGLLHNPKDHCSAFLDKGRPLDLIVRVEGDYKLLEAERVRQQLVPLKCALEQAGYACDQGCWRANPHTVVLGHYRRAFPFDDSLDGQVAWVLDVFNSTLELMSNRKLMELLRIVRPYE
jgi:hypothetical protein